jgi:D-aminoacyl-tRNA deacylase
LKAVIQRVSQASVTINNEVTATINHGFMVLLGIEDADTVADAEWLCQKIVNLRIFDDEAGNMNINILDTKGDLLLVSQFTLHASTKKGNRPSFINAAKPLTALPLYENTIKLFAHWLGKPIFSGTFGANMQVALVNNGPVTIIIDTKNKD